MCVYIYNSIVYYVNIFAQTIWQPLCNCILRVVEWRKALPNTLQHRNIIKRHVKSAKLLGAGQSPENSVPDMVHRANEGNHKKCWKTILNMKSCGYGKSGTFPLRSGDHIAGYKRPIIQMFEYSNPKTDRTHMFHNSLCFLDRTYV